MEQWIYFKNDTDRKKAEKAIKQNYPELFFIVSEKGNISQLHEVGIHAGNWEIDTEQSRIYFCDKEFLVSEEEYRIIEFLVGNYENEFTIAEIAYALNVDEDIIRIKIGDLMKRISDYTGDDIIRKKEEKFYFRG